MRFYSVVILDCRAFGGVCGELYSDERVTRLVLPICLEEKSGRAIGVSLIVSNSDLSIIDETMDIDDGIASNGLVKIFHGGDLYQPHQSSLMN